MQKKIILTLITGACLMFSQGFMSGRSASSDNGFKAFVNPSLLGYEPSGGIMYYNSVEGDDITGHGVLIGMRKLAFGYFKAETSESYVLSSGSEIRSGLYLGSSARWSSLKSIDPEYDLSLTVRPGKVFSAAFNARNIFESNSGDVLYQPSFSYRPFGSSVFDIHAGLEFTAGNFKNSGFSAGFSTDILKGVDIYGGYYSNLGDDKADPVYEIGVSLTLGNLTGGSVGSFKDDNGTFVNYVTTGTVSPPALITSGKNRIVKIELEGQYSEESPRGFLSRIPFIGGRRGKTARELISTINRLADDRSVAGILIVSKAHSMSFTQREELRNALEKFKQKDKKIYSYFVTASQSGYYVLSLSDRIYMYPEGALELQGLGIELMFFKGILDKAGIKMQTVRHGDYKSAVEMFSLEEASPENIEQLERILFRLDALLKNALSEGRNISVDKLNEIMNSVPYHTGRSALEFGFVDGLVYENDLNKTVTDQYGSKVRVISAKDHFTGKTRSPYWTSLNDKKIAIVYATGNIVTGKSSGGGFLSSDNMGSETTAAMIRKARKNRSVKAIVLRVDSGGGSALASDIILTELRLAQTENKIPVIVSMGSTAASGGYWISCYADKIFASKSTVTGSIGVFSMMPSFEEISNRFGVNTQRIVMNDFAARSVFKDLSESERDFLQRMIDEFYKDFIQKVAEARESSYEEIDKVAGGRVWTGEDALDAGLIDGIGGLEEAVKYAVELTGIDTRGGNYLEIFTKHSEFSIGEMLPGVLSGDLKLFVEQISDNAGLMSIINGEDKILKLMPYRIEIK